MARTTHDRSESIMEEDDRSSVCTEDVLGEEAADTAAAAKGDLAWGDKAGAAAAGPAQLGIKHLQEKLQQQQAALMPAQPPSPLSVLALEAELVAKYSDAAAAAGGAAAAAAAASPDDGAATDARFMVDADWLRQWTGYVRGQQGCPPPGPLTNGALYDARTLRLRQGLAFGVDYQALTPTAYFVLAILYGTAEDGSPITGSGGGVAMPPEICRFGSNIYNAEVPPSTLREVSAEAKQRAHAEVNRLQARQRRRILGGGGGGGGGVETMSIVSSCSSFQVGGGARGGGGGRRPRGGEEGGDDDEAAAASCCTRWLYPLCFALVPRGFHRYAQHQMKDAAAAAAAAAGGDQGGRRRGRGGSGGAAGAVEDDVQSMVSASFTLEMGEGEGEEDDDLLLWRSRPKGLMGVGGGGRGLTGATSTML